MKWVLLAGLLMGAPPPEPVAPRTTPVPPPATIRLPSAPSSLGVLTAEDASRIALQRQPELRVAFSRAEAAEGRTAQARAGLFPALTISGSYNNQTPLTGTVSGSGNPAGGGGGSQFSAQVRQLIWDFDQTSSSVGEARHLELAADAEVEQARADLMLRVKTFFYDAVAGRESASVARANLENQQRNLALTRARWQSGLGLPADMVRAQTAVAEATVELNRALAEEVGARVRLAREMGLDARVFLEVSPEDEVVGFAGDIDREIEAALSRRPEALAAAHRVEAADYALTAAERNNAPALSATAGPVTRGPDFPPDSAFFQGGVQLSWPLFDAGLTGGLVHEAEAELEAARAIQEAVRNQVVAEVIESYAVLQAALASLEASVAEVANAAEAVRIAEGRYRAGLGDFTEILDTQAALLLANTHMVQARREARVARAAFERAIGVGLPTPAAPPAPSGSAPGDAGSPPSPPPPGPAP